MTKLLQEGVTAQADARPEATALVFKGTRLTYAALEEASNQLARALKEAGCQRGDRVGLLMPKMPAAIVAMLGTLKADAIYVPMDPASPAARQARDQRLPLHTRRRRGRPETARRAGGCDTRRATHDRMAGRKRSVRH